MADNGCSSRLSSIDSRKTGLQPGAQYVLLAGEERSPVVRISSLLGRWSHGAAEMQESELGTMIVDSAQPIRRHQQGLMGCDESLSMALW